MPDPASLQEQIEQTRAELAETIDAIADKVSPRRVAQRGVGSMKAKVEELRGPDGQPGPAGLGGTSTYRRRVRWDRVAAVGGAVVLIVWLVRRRTH